MDMGLFFVVTRSPSSRLMDHARST